MKHLFAIAKLIEQANLGELGVDLYIETMPDDQNKAIMLDQISPISIDRGQEGFYDTYVQVIVRDPDTEAGYDRAFDLCEFLKFSYRIVDDIEFVSVQPTTLPFNYPRGKADIVETAFKLHVAFGQL